MSIYYQHVPAENTVPDDEPLVLIRNQFEVEPPKKTPWQSLKTHFPGCLIGFISGILIFALALFLYSQLFKTNVSLPEPDSSNSTCTKRIFGYYGGLDKKEIRRNQIEKLTHLVFTGMKTYATGRVKFEHDQARLMFIEMKEKSRKVKKDVKILMSAGYQSETVMMAKIMKDSMKRKLCITSISDFIVEQQIDGVDFYYFPSTDEEKLNYVYFIQELRHKLNRMMKISHRESPYVISVVTPSYQWTDENEVILEDLLDFVDVLNVETDNFNGPWHEDGSTGPLAPLYSEGNDYSIDATMSLYTCKTRTPYHLNFIISLNGIVWTNVSHTDEIYLETMKSAESGTSHAWRDLEGLGWNLTDFKWHEESRTPYIFASEPDELLTFENPRSLVEKAKYAMEKNIGGISIKELEYDDNENSLLNALTSIDMCSGERFKKNQIRFEC